MKSHPGVNRHEWRAEMSAWKEDRNYSLWGVSRSNVGWAQDSNLLWDTENFRLFYALSKDLGDPRFAAAADECARYFLKHCVSPTTGLFAWGHHIGYNVLEDRLTGRRHEIQHHTPPVGGTVEDRSRSRHPRDRGHLHLPHHRQADHGL